MDEMEAGWQLPQEDEFALMNLGAPTPYLSIAFPRTTPEPALEFLDMTATDESQLQLWRNKFGWFMRALTVCHANKRLIMKSPPHTGRVAELLRMYPNAKFIHLTRDPRKLYYSTLRLWHSLDEVQSLQVPRQESELPDYVFTCLKRMYAAFEVQRDLIPKGQLVELRYEDLVADPFNSVRKVYEQLELGDFESVDSKLSQRLTNHSAYRTNSHPIDAETEKAILEHWHDYAEKYGYLNRTQNSDSNSDHATNSQTPTTVGPSSPVQGG